MVSQRSNAENSEHTHLVSVPQVALLIAEYYSYLIFPIGIVKWYFYRRIKDSGKSKSALQWA